MSAVQAFNDRVAARLAGNPELVKMQMEQHHQIVISLREEIAQLKREKAKLVSDAHEKDLVLTYTVVDLPDGKAATLHSLFEDAWTSDYKVTRAICTVCHEIHCDRSHEKAREGARR